jgi:hypothetical protein
MNDEFIDLETPDPRPRDHQLANRNRPDCQRPRRDSAEGNCSHRAAADRKRTHGS